MAPFQEMNGKFLPSTEVNERSLRAARLYAAFGTGRTAPDCVQPGQCELWEWNARE